MSAIVTIMNQSLIMSLENHRTAKEMWDYLQKRYIQDSGGLLYTLMQQILFFLWLLIQQIQTLEQSNMSIDEQYSSFDHLINSQGHYCNNVV
jgi:hypothetical protein